MSREKTIIGKDTQTPVFIASLFTIARTREQPRCPQTEEWIKKMWSICTREYYAAIEKGKTVLLAATWMDLRLSH